MKRDIIIDFRSLAKAFIRQIWIILLGTLLVLLITFIGTLQKGPDQYEADVTLYSTSYESYDSAQTSNIAMERYAYLAKSQSVASAAALSLNDAMLTAEVISNMVHTSFTDGDVVLYIYATSPYPERSVAVANAVAEAFVQELQNVSGARSIRILDEAHGTTQVFSGTAQQWKIRGIAALLAFILFSAMVMLKQIIYGQLQTLRDCSRNGEIEILGVIPFQSDI